MIAQKGGRLVGRGRGRHQDPDRFRKRPAVLRQQLNRLIQTRRIGAALGQDRLTFHGQGRIPRGHTRPVAPNGIDLAVVG